MGVKLYDMTAEVIAFPTPPELVDRTIRATIRALMEGKGLSKEDLAPRVGMSAATLYRKTTEKGPVPFKAHEVALIASALGVRVSDLYDGLGGTFIPPSPDGDDQRPSDYKVAVLSLAA